MTANIYEIINPSDCYTIVGEPEIVATIIMYISRGTFGLKRADGEDDVATRMPLFAFGKCTAEDIDEWAVHHMGMSFGDILKQRTSEIEATLNTVLCCDPGERKAIERVFASITDPEDLEKARAAYHDQKRSSMNDIGGAFEAWATKLRKLTEKEVQEG